MILFSIFMPPFLGFLFNALLFKSSHKKLSGLVAVSACLLSFLSFVFYAFWFGFYESRTFFLFDWIQVGSLSLKFSFVIDSLSLLMGLLITGVGLLIHFYSFFYMKGDSGFTRYFCYLNLFICMMLVLVLASNLPLLFVGWEGVGLCSYLLIGFWFKDKEKVKSGGLAFIANRLGDAFFLLGIFILFSQLGTFEFSEIRLIFENHLKEGLKDLPFPLVLSAVFIFLGATGKSAQIPLYFWLPKAMAGPTPVSALIHAATMVTAGVYLLFRLSFFYMAFPEVLKGIAWLGALTALGSALMACRSSDFKGVLAYSTISQLAYLFMALGVQAFSSSMFHLITHGFFKALLFLCAGSVIHALEGEQNIKKMGGLRSALPITFLTYMAGALALMALPPFSGFFSKDEILWSLFSSGNFFLFFLAFVTGLLTCFYMTRLTFYVFFGQLKKQPHREKTALNIPLIVLAFLSLFAGILGIPHLISELLPFHPPHFLQGVLKELSPVSFKGALWKEALIMFLTITANLCVIACSFYFLKNKKVNVPNFLVLEKLFFVLENVQQYAWKSFSWLCSQSQKRVEDRFFNSIAPFLSFQLISLKKLFSKIQNGVLQSYAFYFTIGLSFVILLLFLN